MLLLIVAQAVYNHIIKVGKMIISGVHLILFVSVPTFAIQFSVLFKIR